MAETPDTFMSEALAEAAKAAALGEVPVGAVIVKDGAIIARAHNEVETTHDATAHAESLAIRRAAATLGTWRLDVCSLYVTLEPCPMCIGAILLSRLDAVYFGATDPVQGAVGSAFDLSSHPNLPRTVEVFSGVLEAECSKLLTDFFASRRKGSNHALCVDCSH